MIGRRQSVGLAMGERHIVAAKVVSARGRSVVRQAAVFAFPNGVSWDEPRELGGHLAAFLREQGMNSPAVVGMPARWLVTARHRVPPLDAQSLAGVLRLAAERAFSLRPEQIVCDYASAPPEGKAGTALLIGSTRERLSAVTEAARAARLKVRAVTSTAATLALAGPDSAEGVTAHLAPDGMDVVLVGKEGIQALCHVPLTDIEGAPAAQALQLGIQSALAAGDGRVEEANLYDGLGIHEDAVREAGERLSLAIRLEPALPVEGLPDAAAAAGVAVGRAAPAAALALSGLERSLLPFDLLKPRLAERPVRHWGRWGAWAAFLLVALLIGAGAVLADRRTRRADIATLQAKLDEMGPSIAAAEGVVDTVNLARGWYDRRPPFLDCLVALTTAFPEEGRVWATSLAVGEDMRGAVTGKSTDERYVLEVLDALNGSGRFADVKLHYIRETRGAAAESAFAIEFTYVGAD